ncbi:hypothetical protein [Carnobacterium maltaromaticum]|uniref:hypothetical protein n=1 Tax=Carnobacterium maltaromaticum TaxID=2751 RepID=UPI0039BE38C1
MAKISELLSYIKNAMIDGYEAHVVSGNTNHEEYEGISDVLLTDLLPKGLGFDMNFHITIFFLNLRKCMVILKPGG